VEIPKPGGGKRPLGGIPTIKNRVVQMAVKLVIEPIFEADFEDEAHGYRPERSALEAVQKLNEMLRGWANYYSQGTQTLAYRGIENYVGDRVRAHMAKRHQTSGRGAGRWPDKFIYVKLGGLRLRDVQYVRV
jgi:hypothetical protein